MSRSQLRGTQESALMMRDAEEREEHMRLPLLGDIKKQREALLERLGNDR